MNDSPTSRWDGGCLGASGRLLLAIYLAGLVLLLRHDLSALWAHPMTRTSPPVLIGALGFDGMVGYLFSSGSSITCRYGGGFYVLALIAYALMFGSTQIICASVTKSRTPRSNVRKSGQTTSSVCEGYVWSVLAMAVLVFVIEMGDQWHIFTINAHQMLRVYGITQPLPHYGNITWLLLIWAGLWLGTTSFLLLRGSRTRFGVSLAHGTILITAAAVLLVATIVGPFRHGRFEGTYTVQIFAVTVMLWVFGYGLLRLMLDRPHLSILPPRHCTRCGAENPTGLYHLGLPCVACGRLRLPMIPWMVRFMAVPFTVLWFVCWFLAGQSEPEAIFEANDGEILLTIIHFLVAWALWSIVLAEQEYVRHQLPKIGRFCLKCNYDLRGTTSAGRTECPECGTSIPHVGGRGAAS